MRRKYMKVGVSLAGGGIRGIAHVGVLKALEENNIIFTYYLRDMQEIL